MRCPLPIDWLEYLEGAHSEELSSHLPACVSCQLLVQELKKERRLELQPSSRPEIKEWPRWTRDDSAAIALGDIRLTADVLSSTQLKHLVVLVVSDVWEEKGESWCDIVPLVSDVERSSSLDLVLHRSDTTLAVPWRVLFRIQTVVNIRDLGRRVGVLTELGFAVVQAALDGHAPEERFGPPIDSPYDERLRIADEIHSFIQLLGRPYALRLESENTQSRLPLVLSLELHRVPLIQKQAGALQLAADSSVGRQDYQWSADIPGRLSFKGRIEYRHVEDELLFVVDEISGIELAPHCWAFITLLSHRLSQSVTSESFVPNVGSRVVLARDLGVMPSEIDRLDVRLSDER